MSEKYKELYVKRIGITKDAFMITTELIDIFPANSTIELVKNNITISNKTDNIILPKMLSPEIPNFTIIDGLFDDNPIINSSLSDNNILGVNSIFYCKIHTIQIPVIKCTNELLHFYECQIINDGDIFKIKNKKEMPFFKVTIGKDYKNDYLLKDGLGDGFYIETHDTPHIHQPANNDAEGFLVLAKRQGPMVMISKFRIPYGKAIYIPPNIYHNDSLLIGDYNVLYTRTDKYNTYVFKTYDNKIVNII